VCFTDSTLGTASIRLTFPDEDAFQLVKKFRSHEDHAENGCEVEAEHGVKPGMGADFENVRKLKIGEEHVAPETGDEKSESGVIPCLSGRMKQLGFDEIDRVPACERGAEEEADFRPADNEKTYDRGGYGGRQVQKGHGEAEGRHEKADDDEAQTEFESQTAPFPRMQLTSYYTDLHIITFEMLSIKIYDFPLHYIENSP
jgi:hypothetical protein